MLRSLRPAALAACLLLAGCPYESPLPLGEARSAPAVLIEGRWIQAPTKDWDGKGSYGELEVMRFNEREYYAELRGFEPFKPVELTRCRVFAAEFGGRRWLDISPLGGDGKHLLASYRLTDDELLVSFLSDEAAKSKPATTAALRRLLAAAPESAFESPLRFTRQAAPPKP